MYDHRHIFWEGGSYCLISHQDVCRYCLCMESKYCTFSMLFGASSNHSFFRSGRYCVSFFRITRCNHEGLSRIVWIWARFKLFHMISCIVLNALSFLQRLRKANNVWLTIFAIVWMNIFTSTIHKIQPPKLPQANLPILHKNVNAERRRSRTREIDWKPVSRNEMLLFLFAERTL